MRVPVFSPAASGARARGSENVTKRRSARAGRSQDEGSIKSVRASRVNGVDVKGGAAGKREQEARGKGDDRAEGSAVRKARTNWATEGHKRTLQIKVRAEGGTRKRGSEAEWSGVAESRVDGRRWSGGHGTPQRKYGTGK